MKLPFKIAVRFLKSSKGQTILIATGIAIGVSVQIFIGSLIQGLQKSLIDKTIGNSSQITVKSNKEDKTIENFEEKISKIKDSDSRIEKIAPAADSPAFIKYMDKSAPIIIRGLNLDPEVDLYSIKSKIYSGEVPKNSYEVLIMVIFTKFALNPDGTPVIPIYLDYKFIMISGVIAVLSASIASLIPARSSSKLEPIEVIKNG